LVTVTDAEPVEVNPVAVNVPEPAVETVKVAVLSVWVGLVVL